MDLLPLFLRLTDRRVLVVGAGTVAARKIEALCAAGARVEVVAPSVNAEVEAMAVTTAAERGRNRGSSRGRSPLDVRVTIHRRAFVETDVDGVWLVIAATNDSAVNAVVAAACESRRVFVNAVDDPPNASAYFGGLIRRGPFTIAISSRGETPALTRLLREVIEGALPPDRWIAEARALRRKWKAEKTPMESRFGELVAAILKPKAG